MTSKFGAYDKSGMIFFLVFSTIMTGFVLPFEILNIIGIRKVYLLKKFNWTRLLFLLPALLAILTASLNADSRTRWYGFDMNHFGALMWFLLIFLYRDNYILTSKKIIRLQGSGGWSDSVKIKWTDIYKIDTDNDMILIESKDKKIELQYQEIRNQHLSSLLKTINDKKHESTGHNNV
jgi:hypothetical protein